MAYPIGAWHRGQQVVAVLESMNGARFVHDTLEMPGWQVEIADAQRVKGFAPLACKTDRIDAWVSLNSAAATSSEPSGCPVPTCAAGRERARWRLPPVRQRTALKNRVHAALVAFGDPSSSFVFSEVKKRRPQNASLSVTCSYAHQVRERRHRRP